MMKKFFINNKNKKLATKIILHTKPLFNKIINIVNNNDIWYIYLIKKEFYIVNRDVLLSKIINIIT